MRRMDSVSHFDPGYYASRHLSFGDAVVMSQFVKSLASVYHDVLEEPLPERLSSLVREVDERLQGDAEA